MKQLSFLRRDRLRFTVACAGLLAAGMAAVWAGGRFAPGREVDVHSALPVYSALGAESADVLFWPEALWEQGAFSAADESPASDLASPWTRLMAGDWEPGSRQSDRPGSLYFLDPEQGEGFYLKEVRFTGAPALVSGLPTDKFYDHALTGELAVGHREGRLGVVCRVWAVQGYRDLPENWREEACQRCFEELLYLFNLSNDDQRCLLFHQLSGVLVRRPWPLAEASFPSAALTDYWENEGKSRLGDMLESLRGMVKSGEYLALVNYSDKGWQDPGESWGSFYNHQNLWADPMPGQEELREVLAQLGLDVQVLPLEDQVLVLFNCLEGSFGVYYDPVLGCFSGFAVQT